MATLYALPASHPCAAVEQALILKGIPFKRVDLIPMTQLLAGPLLYGGITAPGLRIDSERIVGSRRIMRRLDELAPSPPLLPTDDDARRAALLDAERWGDEVLQSVVRRILDAALVRAPKAMEAYAQGADLPLPVAAMRPLMPLTARLMALRNSARDRAVQADLAELPKHLDMIDAWIAEGLLGAEQPNAADLQIGSSIRLLATIADVRPLIEGRAAARLIALFPPQPGQTPAGTLPAGWLPPVAAATAP